MGEVDFPHRKTVIAGLQDAAGVSRSSAFNFLFYINSSLHHCIKIKKWLFKKCIRTILVDTFSFEKLAKSMTSEPMENLFIQY